MGPEKDETCPFLLFKRVVSDRIRGPKVKSREYGHIYVLTAAGDKMEGGVA